MSDRILRALMHLFAIVPQWGEEVADNGGSSSKGPGAIAGATEMVKMFLKPQLSQSLVEKYSAIFREHLEKMKGDASNGRQAKRISLNSVKVLRICTDINKELDAKQKYVVLLRLIEFIYSSRRYEMLDMRYETKQSQISNLDLDQPFEFAKTVAEVFNIPADEYEAALSISSPVLSTIPDSSLFLKIDGEHAAGQTHAKHLYHPSLQGELWLMFIRQAGMFFIRHNGTDILTLNGQTLNSKTTQVFAQGSVIRGPKTDPVYYSDVMHCFMEEVFQTDIDFEASEIGYRFAGGGIGLHNVSFSASSGELIAIMGGSGAGKSTLLNVLNGNSAPSHGKVLINGINLHTERKKTEGLIGYIPQDDLLMEDLSVFQNLFYSARLCFGDMEEKKLILKVNALLENLGLAEISSLKVGNVLNKTISGGQRKRLNIALELIREPAVLFVDEPTSGLSSADSENVMDLLKQLTLSGKLVMVVIHQPSSDIFKLFDKLLLLDIGGYPVYYGNPSDSMIYFKKLMEHADADISECATCGNINPEEIFSILEAKVFDEYGTVQNERKIPPEEWNLHFKKNFVQIKGKLNEDRGTEKLSISKVTGHTSPAPSLKNNYIKPGRWNQFKVFIARDVLSKISNKQYLLLTFLEAPLLAFVLSYLIRYRKPGSEYVFRDNPNIPAYLFMAVIVALFLGLTVSAEEIFRDRKILKREAFLNLSRSSYLFSKIAVMVFLSAIQSLLFVIVGNEILDVKGMLFDDWLVLFSASCFANLLGLNISSAFNSAVTIYILVPLLIIPQILLSGVIVKFDKLNSVISSQTVVPALGDAMTSRWVFEALAVNQYKDNDYEKMFFAYDKEMSASSYRSIFWIGKMEDKIQQCEDQLKAGIKAQSFQSSLELISEEIKRESESRPLNNKSTVVADSVEGLMASLNPQSFSESSAERVKEYLKSLKKYYVDRFNNISINKDKLILQLQSTEGGAEGLKQAKRNYTNEALDDLVLNKNDAIQIAETGNRFIRHYQPVYMDGEKHSLVRTAFYSSRKNIFGSYIDTFKVNTVVIWLMCVLLAAALYYNWLKKVVTTFAGT